MFDELGKLSWLWMNSPLHRDWPVELFSKFILPPIAANQYLLLERVGFPVAYCSWAFLNEKTEAKYMIDPSNISPSDWRQGDNLWFIDWIAPFSKSDSFQLRTQLKAKFANSIARAIRVKAHKTNARVMEFKGPNVDGLVARSQFSEHYQKFLSGLNIQR